MTQAIPTLSTVKKGTKYYLFISRHPFNCGRLDNALAQEMGGPRFDAIETIAR